LIPLRLDNLGRRGQNLKANERRNYSVSSSWLQQSARHSESELPGIERWQLPRCSV
jgi:hypothetical protein